MQHDGAVMLVHEELVHLVRQLMTGERADADMPTFSQHSILSFIERHPRCKATEIAEAFGVHRSTVSRQIRGCLDSGWVVAEAGPVRAGHPLSLTQHGRAMLHRANRDRMTQVARRVRDWPAGEVDEFARLLHRFRITDPHVAPTIPDPETAGGDTNA